MADSLINNAAQARGRCGHFVKVLRKSDTIDRVYCSQCGEMQELWRESERV